MHKALNDCFAWAQSVIGDQDRCEADLRFRDTIHLADQFLNIYVPELEGQVQIMHDLAKLIHNDSRFNTFTWE